MKDVKHGKEHREGRMDRIDKLEHDDLPVYAVKFSTSDVAN